MTKYSIPAADALAKAFDTGKSVSEIQSAAVFENTPSKELPQAVTDFRKNRDALARQQSQLDQEEAAALALANEWANLKENRTRLEKRLTVAQAELQNLKNEFAEVKQWLVNTKLADPFISATAGEIAKNFSGLMGYESAIKFYVENLIPGIQGELEAAGVAVSEFATANKIKA